MRLEQYLLSHPWLPALLWGAAYWADFFAGIVLTKLMVRQRVLVSELPEDLQRSVDNGKYFSWAYPFWFAVLAGTMLAIGYIQIIPEFEYSLIVGMLLISQLWRFVRRLHQISLYRRICGPHPGVSGSLSVSPNYAYREAASSAACFAVVVFVTYLISGNLVLLGGSIGLILTWFRYQLAARRSLELMQAEKRG